MFSQNRLSQDNGICPINWQLDCKEIRKESRLQLDLTATFPLLNSFKPHSTFETTTEHNSHKYHIFVFFLLYNILHANFGSFELASGDEKHILKRPSFLWN